MTKDKTNIHHYQEVIKLINSLEAHLEILTHSFDSVTKEEQNFLLREIENAKSNLQFFSEFLSGKTNQ